jgi:hypothetical protein
LTGSTSRGNGGKYAYYHCHNKSCSVYSKSIPKRNLEQAFIDHLSTIIPNQKFFEAFKETVVDLWHERAGGWEQEAARHEQKLEFLKGKRAKIFQMYEEGWYEKSEFVERKEAVDNEITTTKIAMSEAKIEQFDIEATLNYAINFITNLGRLWFDLQPALRLRFQQLVFPEGLPYTRKNGFGTTKLGLIFEVFEQSEAQKSTGVHHTEFVWNRIVEHLREWEAMRLLCLQGGKQAA